MLQLFLPHVTYSTKALESVYVSVWACALSAKEIQTLLFIFPDLHQWIYWRLETGDVLTNRSVSRIASNRSFCFCSTSSCRQRSFSISFTVQARLQYASQILDFLLVWFVLKSIKLICINNSNLNGFQSLSIASQKPRSSNKASLSCVCMLSNIKRERERLKLFTLSSKNELTAKVLAGNVHFKHSLRYCLVFFIKLRLASVRSWHLIVAIFGSSTKFQDFLETWPHRKRYKKGKQTNPLHTSICCTVRTVFQSPKP